MSPTMALALVLGALVGGLAVALVLVVRARARRRRVRQAAERGYAAEGVAPALLRHFGFTVIEAQPRASYEYWIDGVVQRGQMQPDFLVCRQGRRYAAEVKTGHGRRPTHLGTRRQLLEYATYFGVDGVVLIDGDTDTLFEVDFPRQAPPPQAPPGTNPGRARAGWVLAALIGAAIGAAVSAIAH